MGSRMEISSPHTKRWLCSVKIAWGRRGDRYFPSLLHQFRDWARVLLLTLYRMTWWITEVGWSLWASTFQGPCSWTTHWLLFVGNFAYSSIIPSTQASATSFLKIKNSFSYASLRSPYQDQRVALGTRYILKTMQLKQRSFCYHN